MFDDEQSSEILALRHWSEFRRRDAFARALQDMREAIRREWLEEIIRGTDLECAQRMLIVRGDEHHVWSVRLDGVDNAKAIEPRHLDVEKHDVGSRVLDCRDGF